MPPIPRNLPRKWVMTLGSSTAVLPSMPDNYVDAVVTDPPAGIAFMGKAFDTFKGRDRFIDWLADLMAECLRVCKPGGVALVWALPRTSHWTGTALEDAGWQIEDRISHLFGTGFPKHKSKLKPACEDWWLCRKPGPKWLGVEECRLATVEDTARKRSIVADTSTPFGRGRAMGGNGSPAGRWPANVALSHHEDCRLVGTKRVKADVGGSRGKGKLFYGLSAQPDKTNLGYADADGMEEVETWDCHPECPVRLLDEQAGERRPGERPARATSRPGANGTMGDGWSGSNLTGKRVVLDSGGASRFFYVAKSSRKDRGKGNLHPTVKSTALMSWLVKLACPAGGLVLDPFAGSGSTGVACLMTGRRFVGVESEPEYHAIAVRRLKEAADAADTTQP